MADPFANINGLNDQGRKLSAVSLSDTVDLANIPKALLCTVSGNIAITAADGNYDSSGALTSTSIVVAVTAGQAFWAVRVKRIWATGTTATVLAIS